jgi:hypothetical protein
MPTNIMSREVIGKEEATSIPTFPLLAVRGTSVSVASRIQRNYLNAEAVSEQCTVERAVKHWIGKFNTRIIVRFSSLSMKRKTKRRQRADPVLNGRDYL